MGYIWVSSFAIFALPIQTTKQSWISRPQEEERGFVVAGCCERFLVSQFTLDIWDFPLAILEVFFSFEYMRTYQNRIFKFKPQLLRLHQWWWWVLQLLERASGVVLRIYYRLVYILKLMISPSYSVDVSFQSHKIYSHHIHHEWLLSSETHLCPSATSTLETTPNLQQSCNHPPHQTWCP